MSRVRRPRGLDGLDPFEQSFAADFRGKLVAGRALYDEVIAGGLMQAKQSAWIATANVKELYVERPGLRRSVGSIVSVFSDLAARGVELRLLHAELPSRPFRASFDRHPSLVRGGLAVKQCPRVHLKAIVVDGTWLYLGSANLTGAGLGAKGDARRNFEAGIMTSDERLLDEMQGVYERIWSGGECAPCRLRDVCPRPLDIPVTKPATTR